MGSERDRTMLTTAGRAGLGLAATLASGAGLYFGTGLDPLPWLTWFTLLPVLLVARRLCWWTAGLVAAGAWLGGELNEWTYLTHDIGMPPVRAGLIFAGAAVLFALAVLAFRALVRHERWVAAALLVPALWVGFEYLFAISSPDGAFWSLAYTQAGVLPLIQLASLTSYLGVSFVLLLVPATLAVLLSGGVSRATQVRLAAGVSVGLLAVVGYGLVQLGRAGTGPSVRIAMIAQPGDGDRVDIATASGAALFDGYLAQVRASVHNGAKVVVLPELVFTADAGTLSRLTGPLSTLARGSGATILLGVGLVDNTTGGWNTAQIMTPDGGVTAYRKQHLLFTEPYQPGDALTDVARQPWGVVICKDLDFPDLIRAYRDHGAQLMLAPAWDVDRDAWLHSRMAIVRGVETGMPIVRSGRMSALTISDAHGRVLAEARTTGSGFATVTYDLPVAAESTVYSWSGPWFAWMCLLAALAALAQLRRRPAPEPVDDASARAEAFARTLYWPSGAFRGSSEG